MHDKKKLQTENERLQADLLEKTKQLKSYELSDLENKKLSKEKELLEQSNESMKEKILNLEGQLAHL